MEQTQTFTGKGVAPPAKGHHFLHIDDFSKEELQAMLNTAMEVLSLRYRLHGICTVCRAHSVFIRPST